MTDQKNSDAPKDENERLTPIQWWMKYVIVPLVGSGGIVSVLAVIFHDGGSPNYRPGPSNTAGNNKGRVIQILGEGKVTYNEASEPEPIPFREEVKMEERDAAVSHGLVFKSDFIGAGGPQGMWADLSIEASGNEQVSTRASKGASFTIGRRKGSDVSVDVKDISIAMTDPHLSLDDVQKMGIAGEAFLTRQVVLLLTGEDLPNAK